MKFGEYLKENMVSEWSGKYVNYDALKSIISSLEEKNAMGNLSVTSESKQVSLTMALPTNAAGQPLRGRSDVSPEQFFGLIELEMKKVDDFTKKKVSKIRQVLSDIEVKLSSSTINSQEIQSLRSQLDDAAEEFLKLEKYVNLNCTGFHKILKKHDRRLPNPCKAFYVARLHEQSWIKGDYSDVMVTLSRIYSAIRGDEESEAKENEKQDFVRSTRKYWVRTEDISRVKFIVLQHLPVFLQSTMGGESDAQLVNSVYVDNMSMELYHGRLDKTTGAIALRMRWYGTGIPQAVFVERKTHRESWAGEVSVKERFAVKENQVLNLLNGTFDKDYELSRLQKKGKSAEDISEWNALVSEVIQAVGSKQLRPTMRTQYMRTAFQIPFDATVRVSLDTNLCMINERTGDTANGQRWYRDPNKAVPLDEITRFPHAVLEVKLEVQGENATPEWVTQLINSGMLHEVHKFSKFIHGCAILLPEDIRAVPYWVDDPSLKASIIASGAEILLENSDGANKTYNHLLVHGMDGNPTPKVKTGTKGIFYRNNQVVAISVQNENSSVNDESMVEENVEFQSCGEYVGGSFSCCEHASVPETSSMVVQKVEPKLLFANERTFIKWLHMAVTVSSVAIGILAFTSNESDAQIYALLLLPVALLFIIYAINTFLWRVEKIRTRDPLRWDDPMGPVVLTICLLFALIIQFIINAMQVFEEMKASNYSGLE